MAFLLLLVVVVFSFLQAQSAAVEHYVSKRMIPNHENCNPLAPGNCEIGDFVDKTIADCYYDHTPGTCSASGTSGSVISWVVSPEKQDRCKPNETGKKFRCGAQGTNTRCVCSDHKIEINHCRCQYWTNDIPEKKDPAFCTAYYLGGDTKVHHYACCNNCNDTMPDTSCDRHTYEGGSSSNYCERCGNATGGGLVKFVFNCVTCDAQSKCESKCNSIFGLKLPGFCWKWVDCFKGCCEATVKAKKLRHELEMLKRKRFSATGLYIAMDREFDFCGDGECSDSESLSECPLDCCHKVNSNCSNAPQHCTQECCRYESCCLNS